MNIVHIACVVNNDTHMNNKNNMPSRLKIYVSEI